jgi:hypothetical protein
MTASKRRRLYSGLATLSVVAIMFASWLRWNFNRVQERQRVRQEIGWRGARLFTPGFLAWVNRSRTTTPSVRELPAIWALLGAEPLGSIELPEREFNEDEQLRIQSLFPEADISIATSPPGMGQGVM